MTDNDQSKRNYPPLDDFGLWVARKVETLVYGTKNGAPGYLNNGSDAVAAIAQLYKNVGHPVGSDPAIFEWTLTGLPESGEFRKGDMPTIQENVAHEVMTLFAVQQHSIRDESMHTSEKVTMGSAVGQLAYGHSSEKGIRREFSKIQTAKSDGIRVRSARKLVILLKRGRIPLNYGLLAQDLLALESGHERANWARMKWGRDFLAAYNRQQYSAEH